MPVYAELGEEKRIEINKNAEAGARNILPGLPAV